MTGSGGPTTTPSRRRLLCARRVDGRQMGGVAATACGYGTTTPSPRRRAGTTRPHQQETNRDAGPAPGARPSGTWPCSGPWPPSPSSGARPSPRPRGRRAHTCELTGDARARVRGQLDGVARAPPLRTTLICSGSILCSCARRGRRPRAPANQRCFFHIPAAIPPRRAGPGGPAPRVGGGSGGEAALLVVRTLDGYPFTATDGLATLRGAKAVALPARARMTEVFILQIYPLLFLLSKSHDDMACGKKCTRPGA